jgi:hypothetical protein
MTDTTLTGARAGRAALAAAVLAATVSVLLAPSPVSAQPREAVAATKDVLQARPAEVDFKTKRVGTENYKRTRITNTGDAPVVLLVSAGLPDDFGFGLMPGQTCPVFSPGEVLGAGDSCYAVVRFSPSEFFVGWQAVGELLATATDPATAVLVDELSIPVLGRAVL